MRFSYLSLAALVLSAVPEVTSATTDSQHTLYTSRIEDVADHSMNNKQRRKNLLLTPEELFEVQLGVGKYEERSASIEVGTPARDHFIGTCENTIYNEYMADDFVTQHEVTDFLIDYCKENNEEVCDENFTIEFDALNPLIQIAFARFVCPIGDELCVKENKNSRDPDFGYVLEDGHDPLLLRADVNRLCTALWYLGTAFHGGTDAPTVGPSSIPSFSPTAFPSASPSSKPSHSPTAFPSSVPSASPSMKPSTKPSQHPSSSPSSKPSSRPSFVPSSKPSSTPSLTPTGLPTSAPSLAPTSSPSFHPSMSPSSFPTASPSFRPSNFPVASPSAHPTAIPSFTPTISDEPSNNPSSGPTFIGSSPPTISPAPSKAPTKFPSHSPTTVPSGFPSSSPTSVPTSSPSSHPSASPSTGPSSSPSGRPSPSPSELPSRAPSAQPTLFPSKRPTFMPSNSPSSQPSSPPSSRPSSSPSESPTHRPSVFPSMSPSDLPSMFPTKSNEPSSTPSSKPTYVGTLKPSVSVMPTTSPSKLPSSSPTGFPTSFPSQSPTGLPSQPPSNSPTFAPSASPSSQPSGFPSVKPTSSPSLLPSNQPTAMPSKRPTLFPGHTMPPSESPSSTPSAKPTISHAPSKSMQPSASPTRVIVFQVQFSYMIGFENSNITARSLDDANRDDVIMDDVRSGLRRVLALSDITRRNLRQLISFKGDDAFQSIYHKNITDKDCPEEFDVSQSCVEVRSEVIVHADPEQNSETSVAREVKTPIQESMGDGVFLALSSSSIKEVKYLGDPSDNGDGEGDPDIDPLLNNGELAGIAIGAVVLVAAVSIFGVSRSTARDDRELPEIGSSDVSEAEGRSIDPEIYVPKDSKAQDSNAAQLDVATGDVIIPAVAAVSDGASSDASSHYSESDTDGEILIGRLDEAVSRGDWAAVAAIAGDLSTADEASTMSSVNSTKMSDSRSRDGLSSSDAKRAATIDKLIVEGDWNAVGATAAEFDKTSSSGSASSKSENSFKDGNNDGKRKSLLDFIAGPWQSSAAEKAMVDEGNDGDVSDLNISSMQSEAVSSLSGGLTPDRARDLDPEAGQVFKPMMPPTPYSNESSTDDDTKPILGGDKKEKGGWKGRFSLRKKNDEDARAANNLSLQEDSSVSSWSQGSPDSPPKLNIYSSAPVDSNEPPAEMKAFGEDFGLAAAELAMRQEEEAKDNASEVASETISVKSSNSLRDELDKAIETGDWAAVEAQTNKMFDMNIDDLDVKAAAKPSKSSSFDSDEDSREGWSDEESNSMISDTSEVIDDERIAILEKLIETDDWQGIVADSLKNRTNGDDSSMNSSLDGEITHTDGLLSLAPEKDEEEEAAKLDEDLSFATDRLKP